LLGAGHVGTPDGVDAQVFVEDHEEVVEPALAEAFVVDVGVAGVGGIGLVGRRDVSFGGGDGRWEGELTSSLPDLTTSDVTVCSGFSIESSTDGFMGVLVSPLVSSSAIKVADGDDGSF